MNRKLLRFLLAAFAFAPAASTIAQTTDYPTQTVRVIVPYAPGGGTDITARIVAELLSKEWGQSVIIENRPGAASQIGIDFVSKAKPDGYTLLWASSDGLSVLPAVKATVPYKIPGSFEFISSFSSYPLVHSVSAKLPITNMKEFVEYSKAHPGQMSYASTGPGGGSHLQAAYIAKELGLDLKHVPYDSGGPASVAVAGGHAEFTEQGPSTVLPYIKAGTLRAIVVSGSKRASALPDVPTIAEAGYPNLTSDLYYGILAPAGTPAAIVRKVRDDVQKALKSPGMTERLNSLGLEPFGLTGDEFRTFVVNDLNRWTKAAKAIDFRLSGP